MESFDDQLQGFIAANRQGSAAEDSLRIAGLLALEGYGEFSPSEVKALINELGRKKKRSAGKKYVKRALLLAEGTRLTLENEELRAKNDQLRAKLATRKKKGP